MRIPGPGKLEMVFTGKDGQKQSWEVNEFTSAGVAMSMYNTEDSIKGFARSCFEFALERKM